MEDYNNMHKFLASYSLSYFFSLVFFPFLYVCKYVYLQFLFSFSRIGIIFRKDIKGIFGKMNEEERRKESRPRKETKIKRITVEKLK